MIVRRRQVRVICLRRHSACGFPASCSRRRARAGSARSSIGLDRGDRAPWRRAPRRAVGDRRRGPALRHARCPRSPVADRCGARCRSVVAPESCLRRLHRHRSAPGRRSTRTRKREIEAAAWMAGFLLESRRGERVPVAAQPGSRRDLHRRAGRARSLAVCQLRDRGDPRLHGRGVVRGSGHVGATAAPRRSRMGPSGSNRPTNSTSGRRRPRTTTG